MHKKQDLLDLHQIKEFLVIQGFHQIDQTVGYQI